MENDFSAKLQNLLSDPTALSKITAIASSLGLGSESSAEPTQPEAEPSPTTPPQFSPIIPSDPRFALLSSVKPLLREEKRGKVDSLLNALAVANMLKNFRK